MTSPNSRLTTFFSQGQLHRGLIEVELKTVIVETMPNCFRESHRAAGNWGQYPQNGARRERIELGEAEKIVAEDEDEYDHIVPWTEEGED